MSIKFFKPIRNGAFDLKSCLCNSIDLCLKKNIDTTKVIGILFVWLIVWSALYIVYLKFKILFHLK